MADAVKSNAGLLEAFQNVENPPLHLSYEPYPYQKQAAVILDGIYGKNARDPANILAASPTGSGKSFLISWSALRAWQTGSRLIIVVPLVSLALQTYSNLRELLRGKEATFEDYLSSYDDDMIGSAHEVLGVHTGSCEVHADCSQILVMTFEVLLIKINADASYLEYNVPAIIFDEIHFITDPQRGYIVENLLQNLPRSTCVVGLSGTLPNKRQFAGAIAAATRRSIHVIGKKTRPITLDYSIHIGGGRQPFVFLTRPDPSGQQSVARRFKRGALAYVNRVARDRPEKLSFRQKRGRMLQLVKDLSRTRRLPALVVAFSCRALNNLARSIVNSVDLVDSKRAKYTVRAMFGEIKARVPEGEWELFQPLEAMACRGIATFHSQMPTLYCELVPRLVKRGFIRLIFTTSSLSTGVDLPVRSVCVLETRRPSARGFVPVEPSLMHQMFGRAGRPGQESQGHATLVKWTRSDDHDIEAMLTAPAEEVMGHGLIRPRPLLAHVQRNGEPRDLLVSPFSWTGAAEDNPLFDDLARLLSKLEGKGFLRDGIITPIGRMVPSIVGCDDALSLVVAWTDAAIPRDSAPLFCGALTCFLQNKRHGQPADARGIYDRLCEIQVSVTDEEADLGTSMMEPIIMWVEDSDTTVARIVRECDSNPGHVCKTILRLTQLLEQLRDAGARVGDHELASICTDSLERASRGLPFVPSLLLE